MKKHLLALPLAFLTLAALVPPRQLPVPYRLYASTRLPGAGGWDFLATDPAGERLYVTHGDQLEVLDAKTAGWRAPCRARPPPTAWVAIPPWGAATSAAGATTSWWPST